MAVVDLSMLESGFELIHGPLELQWSVLIVIVERSRKEAKLHITAFCPSSF